MLIISYYWPPAGGISVLRTLKFVKYLQQFGWRPIVYAPKNANYPYFDNNNFKDIPDDIITLRKKIIEPFGMFKFLTGRKKNDSSNPVYAKNKNSFLDNFSIWLRGNFFIPDARCLWINPSVKFLSKYLRENPVDAILTDGPPHTNTVIGMKLSEKFNTPWLADFQDPWTQVDYYQMMKIGKRADNKHNILEQNVFKTAKKITIASPTWAKDMESIGAKNVDVIYYGYDEDDFKDVKKTNNNTFSILHAGILGEDRNSEIFFKVLKDIFQKTPHLKEKVKLNFAGIIDISVKKSIEKNNLLSNLNSLGNLPRKNILNLMINANLLLLPVNKADNSKGRLPGKLYEYLRAQVPILALGKKNSDVETILNQTKTGKLFEYDDYQGIYNFLDSVFNNRFQFSPDIDTIKNFTVEKQTQKIANYLNEITK